LLVTDGTDIELEHRGGGIVGLQISNAIGHLHKELVGRGPSKIRTYLDDDLVVCLLEGGFTQAEQTLLRHSGDELVIEMRLRLQAAMRTGITETVQSITGRTVRSFMSANDPARDLQVEVLVLDPAAQDAGGADESLAARRLRALEAARVLREERSALQAEHDQTVRSITRRKAEISAKPRSPNHPA
jgi:uncharacterized protein YbcI